MPALLLHVLLVLTILLFQVVPTQTTIATTINTFDVLETIPHDPNAFTQGLTFDTTNNHVVFESTGLYGQSDVRQVDLTSGDVLNIKSTPSEYFGEGLAYFGDRKLIHIVWKEQTGFIMDADTLETLETFSFSTRRNEGWGITYNPTANQFLVTDGSSYLHVWDATSLQEISRISVTLQLDDTSPATAVTQLNEIEWDASTNTVLANVWQTDLIMRIDPTTGHVLTRYDLSQLYPKRAPNANVLNGIAMSPNQDLWVTGKKWPHMYRIVLGTTPTDGPLGTPPGGSSSCFSGENTVHVLDKGYIYMKDLSVGDQVRVFAPEEGSSNNTHTHQLVYAFAHYAPQQTAEFLQIVLSDNNDTDRTTLEVTADHLVYLHGKTNPVRAGSLKVGDILLGSSSSHSRDSSMNIVQSIGRVQRMGLYAPLTADGSILVNGVTSSTYVSLQQPNGDPEYVTFRWLWKNHRVMAHHDLAHWFLSPFRWVCTKSISTASSNSTAKTNAMIEGWCHSYNEQGLPAYVSFGIRLFQFLEFLNSSSFWTATLALLLLLGWNLLLLWHSILRKQQPRRQLHTIGGSTKASPRKDSLSLLFL